jgi:hypothetical protein
MRIPKEFVNEACKAAGDDYDVAVRAVRLAVQEAVEECVEMADPVDDVLAKTIRDHFKKAGY